MIIDILLPLRQPEEEIPKQYQARQPIPDQLLLETQGQLLEAQDIVVPHLLQIIVVQVIVHHLVAISVVLQLQGLHIVIQTESILKVTADQVRHQLRLQDIAPKNQLRRQEVLQPGVQALIQDRLPDHPVLQNQVLQKVALLTQNQVVLPVHKAAHQVIHGQVILQQVAQHTQGQVVLQAHEVVLQVIQDRAKVPPVLPIAGHLLQVQAVIHQEVVAVLQEVVAVVAAEVTNHLLRAVQVQVVPDQVQVQVVQVQVQVVQVQVQEEDKINCIK